MNTVTWNTPKGSFEYEAFTIGTEFKSVPGNYVFAKQIGESWYAVYVGQTEDLGQRLASHEKQPCAVSNGATHILVKSNNNALSRLSEESAMIDFCQPVCNERG